MDIGATMTKNKTHLIAIFAFILAGCEGPSDIKSHPAAAKNVITSPTVDVKIPQNQAASSFAGVLNVNTATSKRLSHVSGMTTEIEKLIKDLRPFLDIVEFDDELEALGVKSKVRSSLYQHLFVLVDVNNSSFEELVLIPNVSRRNAFAIVEARPYASQEVFLNQLEKSFKKDRAKDVARYFIFA